MYEIFKSQNIQSSIAQDVQRMKTIFGSKEILFRKTRYFYEFIFNDIKWDRNLFIKLERALSRVHNNIRFSHDINNHLLVTIDRWNILSDDPGNIKKSTWDYKG